MKKILFSILIVLLSVSFAWGQGNILIMKKKVAACSETPFAECTAGTDTTNLVGTRYVGQKDFDPSTDAGDVCRLDFNITTIPSAGTCTAYVFTMSGNNLGTEPDTGCHSNAIAYTALTAGWNQFNLLGPCNISNGSTYGIVITCEENYSVGDAWGESCTFSGTGDVWLVDKTYGFSLGGDSHTRLYKN